MKNSMETDPRILLDLFVGSFKFVIGTGMDVIGCDSRCWNQDLISE